MNGLSGNWPYNVNPGQYIQQATSQQPMAGTTPPSFRSQWYQPPNQQSPLRDQLVSLFGNALMSHQGFPQIMQSLMQNPGAAQQQLGLLSPPRSYTPDANFWRINWNNPPSGGSANTSSAAGGNPVTGAVTGAYPPGTAPPGASAPGGSANGATGAAGAGSTGAGVGAGASVSGGEAGGVGASVGGNSGTDASAGTDGTY